MENKNNATDVSGLKIESTILHWDCIQIGYGTYNPNQAVKCHVIIICRIQNSKMDMFQPLM